MMVVMSNFFGDIWTCPAYFRDFVKALVNSIFCPHLSIDFIEKF